MKSRNIGETLKELRLKAGFTQDYVAKKLGVKRQAYSHYETGSRCISVDQLAKIATLYDVSVDEILYLKPQGHVRDKNMALFMFYFEQLSEKDKKELIEIARIKIRSKQQ